jgi:hypothetical protein
MRKTIRLSLKNLCLCMYLSLVLYQNAYAYLDPQTGSYIFQVLIAASLSAVFTIKLWWTKVISFFKNIFSSKDKG